MSLAPVIGEPRAPWGLPGATAATRYVGATAAGAPASGTFAVGDFSVDQTGEIWVCTVAGSPGTWSNATTTGGVSNAAGTAIASGTGGVSGNTTIATNNVVRMTVGFGGNVGIGTGSPAFTLDVNGTAHATTVTSPNVAGHGTIVTGSVVIQPVMQLYRKIDAGTDTRMWQWGLDVANDLGDGLLSSLFLARGYQDGTTSVQDVFFVSDYNVSGTGAPLVAFGFGYTPPPSGYRLAVAAPDNTSWGALNLRMGASTTGPYVYAHNSAGVTYFNINNDGSLSGVDNSISTLGLAITDAGNDASQVLTVIGRTTQTADILHVNTSGKAGYWAIQRDGTNDVQAVLHASGGTTPITLRSQSTIAFLQAHAAGDSILVLRMAATPSAAPFTIQTSSVGVLFQVDQTGNVTIADGGNIVSHTSTGTKIGTATNQKIAFFNATPVVQPATTGTTTGYVTGVSTPVLVDGTFTGNTGATAYTIGDIVNALKLLGLIAA